MIDTSSPLTSDGATLTFPGSVGITGSFLRNVKQEIWVTFAFPGLHCYPDAPEEVAYLRQVHRHMFQFKVGITVHHDDREIEFHMMKNWLTGLYNIDKSGEAYINVNHKSCEMLAAELIDRIVSKYDCSRREVKVEVSEDGECGAIVTSLPHYINARG